MGGIRTRLFDCFQRERTVHGRANDFDRRIAGEDRRNKLAHQRRIINDENANPFAHAMAPRGEVRFSRESTAGTLRMRTTVPSPRMEAPLTRSLEMISLGSALMTSSSSPTVVSTNKPKRLSPTPVT